MIEDTGGCDEIGDICFSSAISPVFDKSTDVVNNSCDHSEEDIHEKNIGNNYNENNENNLSKESEPITFDRTVDTDDLKQICTEKVKSQELCIDLDLSGITATSSSENSGFIINKEIQIPSGANLEIINDDNESLEHKSNNNQIYTDISQRKTINFRSEENMDVVLTNNENQYRANDDADNLLRTEDRCNKSSEINVINTETAFMSSTGSQSCETLYLECNEYLYKISFQSKDEKYTPVIEDRDLIGFLADNCIVKETDNIPNTYSEVSINNRENSTVLVPFESNASRVIGNDAVQHPTITLYDIGIQTGDCENSIIDMKSSGSTNTIMKADLKRPVIKKSISTLISEHITHIDDTCINLLKDTLKSQRGSNEYFPHSVLNGDFLGFTKKVRKLTNRERPEVRVIRKRMNWNRMKAELFHSLVKYFNKKMKFNQTNFLGQGNNSSLSSNSKNARRLRMLRWKKLREFYLSSTDTDSDRTKNSRHVKKRSKCKTPENKAFKEINDPSCNSSEDEYIFKMVISEQQKYQRLFLEQQELEEFYNTLVDNVVNNDSSDQAKKSNDLSFSKSDNCGTWQQDNVSFIVDKDDVNSGDSGYSKSDSDNVSIKPDYKKKRIGDFKTDKNIHNKKRAAIKCLSNKTCDLKRHERSCIIDREKQNCKETKTDSSEAVNINSERPHDLHLTDANLESVEVSHEPKSKKECITADICSLLHSSSSEENKILVNDDILKETFDVNQCYLFSSDCESISINDEDKLIETDPFDTKTKDDNKKQEESLGTRVFKCDHKIIANCKRQSCYDNPNKPLNQIRQSNHSSATLKVSTQQKRKKSTSKIHSTPVSNQPTPSQFQGTIDIEDPLHVRLQQESLKDVPRVVKPGETIRTAFKRSNSLKKRQTLLETIALNIEQNNTVILPKEINTLSGKPKKLHEGKIYLHENALHK